MGETNRSGQEIQKYSFEQLKDAGPPVKPLTGNERDVQQKHCSRSWDGAALTSACSPRAPGVFNV